jgi:Rrf2 family protein
MAHPTNTQFAVAVHILTLLANAPDDLQSSEQMAESVGSNPVHLRRVLGRLRRAGIVDSRPGPHGGWRLRSDPDTLHLGEIWRAVDGVEHVLGLHEANPDCPVGRRMQRSLAELDRRCAAALVAELDRTTVADLLKQASQPALAAG